MGNKASRQRPHHVVQNYNANINNFGGAVGVQFRALGGERHPQIARLRIDNDTQSPVTVELKTPGGLFVIASQTVGAEELEDIDALKATYDLVLILGERTETIQNLRLSEDTTATLSALLSGDLAGLPRDESARAVTQSTRVDEFFGGDVLATVVEEAEVQPGDRLGEALERYTAHVRAELEAARKEGQQEGLGLGAPEVAV
ncbi:hypothetical protein DENSPDRAFT_842346 [Dentipellis sp. KUC8613]|nr:hypothetical protein DENSPDRAFT_842346 [Dentipellis sp. KUC8613]